MNVVVGSDSECLILSDCDRIVASILDVPSVPREIPVESMTMGKVLVSAVIENLDDLFALRKGLLSADQVRRFEVDNALIGSGAMKKVTTPDPVSLRNCDSRSFKIPRPKMSW